MVSVLVGVVSHVQSSCGFTLIVSPAVMFASYVIVFNCSLGNDTANTNTNINTNDTNTNTTNMNTTKGAARATTPQK